MPGYGKRYWAERTADNRRRTYPKFRGRETVDAVVIGGGLTGCAAALALARAHVRVVLLEADRLAGGATAGGCGVIVPQPDAWYRAAEHEAGRRAARVAFEAAQKSSSEFVHVLQGLPTRCDLQPASFLVDTASPGDLAALRKEQAARRDAGLVAPWHSPQASRAEMGSESHGALLWRDGHQYDPVRAALGLAGAAEAAGARIFERSPVRRTTFTRKDAEVVLTSGRLRTRLVFVATGEPGQLFGQLRRHVRRSTGYAVVTEPLPAAMRRETGKHASIVTDLAEPPHWLRWLSDDRALFAGAASKPVSTQQRDKALVQRTAQLMYELSLRHPIISGLRAAWSWDLPVVTTPDTLPWIGPHRNYPHHFFALAMGWHGDGLIWRAARAAVRQYQREPDRDDAVLGFARYL